MTIFILMLLDFIAGGCVGMLVTAILSAANRERDGERPVDDGEKNDKI